MEREIHPLTTTSIILFFVILSLWLIDCDGLLPIDQSTWNQIKLGYPTGIILTPAKAQVAIESSLQLKATVRASNSEYRAVSWNSSVHAVATVDGNGLMQAVSLGTAVITVTSVYGGYTASCTVTVVPITVTGVKIDSSIVLDLYGTSHPVSTTLTAVILPSNATNKSVTWYSENTGIASVDQQGMVTAKGIGTTRIKVLSVANPDIYVFCAVSVIITSTPYNRRYSLNVGNVVAAEYSRALDRIVAISNSPNQLSMIDPASGNANTVSLPQEPLSLGLSIDGVKATIGYNCFVGTVDLGTGIPVVIHTWPITAYTGYGVNRGDIRSIMIDPLGYIYAIDGSDQWIDLRQIDSNTGAEGLKNGGILRAGGVGRIHKGGNSIYCIFFPGYWLGRIDISNPAADPLPNYYFTKGMESFWFFDTGEALFTSTGRGYSVTQAQSTDLGLLGSFSIPSESAGIRWADHHSGAAYNSVTGLIAAIPWVRWDINNTNVDHVMCLINASNYTLLSSIVLPDFSINGTDYGGHGRFCFWNSTGTELNVVIQSSGAPNPNLWDLAIY